MEILAQRALPLLHSFALVQPLFHIVEIAASSDEYIAELALSILKALVCSVGGRVQHEEGSREPDGDTLLDELVGNFELKSLAQMILDGDSPHLASYALELLVAAVPILPSPMLAKLVPLLADEATRALARDRGAADGSAALSAARHALATMLPPLINRGLLLRPLLRRWVQLVLAAPQSERPALLAAVLADNSASESYLHTLLAMLLRQHVCNRECILRAAASAASGSGMETPAQTGTQGGTSAEELKLALTACAAAPAHAQLVANALLISTCPLLLPTTTRAAGKEVNTTDAQANLEDEEFVDTDSTLARGLSLVTLRFVAENLERSVKRGADAWADESKGDRILPSAGRLFSALVAAHAETHARTCKLARSAEPSEAAALAEAGMLARTAMEALICGRPACAMLDHKMHLSLSLSLNIMSLCTVI